jgi:energy-coupling factor transport system permease protein
MSGFTDYHPAVIFFYFISVSAITMFVNNPVLLLLSLAGAGLSSRFGRRRSSIRGLLWNTGLFVLIAAANPLFNHRGQTVLFFMNGRPVTYEAFIYGINMAVTMMAVLNWCGAFTRIMTSDKLLFLFGKVTPGLSVVLSMAVRFIPLFRRQAERVSLSQKAMGLYAGDNYMDKARGAARVFSILLTWSLENAIDTAASMRARGYGIKKRTRYSVFHIRPRDIMLSAVGGLLVLVTVTGSAMGYMEFEYYPKLGAVPASVEAVFIYFSYGLLVMLPVVIDTKERLKWRYFRSRI